MKTSQLDLVFPVLGFTLDQDVWGFRNLRDLTTCGKQTLKKGMQDGMELVDADGRCWRVMRIEKLGPTGPWWTWLLGQPLFRIAQEVEALPPLTLSEVQGRVCDAMLAHPDFWCEPEDRSSVLPARLEEVRSTTSIAGIHDVLGLDTFENY